jgi:chaperonin GroEL
VQPIEKVKASTSKTRGYNVASGKFEDLLLNGVLDPAKVTKTALRNAASASSVLLTADFAIVEK